jgi:uncharacterized membrane protein YeaQ/YmgE (transglycosylase-associated protein family)
MKKKVYLATAAVGALMSGFLSPTGDALTILLLFPITVISSLILAVLTKRLWITSKDKAGIFFGIAFGILGSYLGVMLLYNLSFLYSRIQNGH